MSLLLLFQSSGVTGVAASTFGTPASGVFDGGVFDPGIFDAGAGVSSWSTAAVGVEGVPGVAASAFGWSTAAAGAEDESGVTASAFGWSTEATGMAGAAGDAASTFTWSTEASGAEDVPGVAASAFTWSTDAAGAEDESGTSASAFGWATAGQGGQDSPGVADSAFGWSTAASGDLGLSGTAASTFTWSTEATGAEDEAGVAASEFGWSTAATGSFDFVPVTGDAANEFGWSTEASGVEDMAGVAASEFGWSTVAAGSQGISGDGASEFGWTTEGAGDTVDTSVTGAAASTFGGAGNFDSGIFDSGIFDADNPDWNTEASGLVAEPVTGDASSAFEWSTSGGGHPNRQPFALTEPPYGGWTQIPEPRAVYFNGVTYFGYVNGENGNVEIRTYTHATSIVSGPTVLQAAIDTPADSHDAPAILIRPDGHLVVSYSAHNGNTLFVKISDNPEDISGFSAYIVARSGGQFTYPVLVQRLAEPSQPIYIWHRSRPSGVSRLSYVKSADGGLTWDSAVDVYAPAYESYWKIATDSQWRIDFIVTDGNPSAGPSTIHHFYADEISYHASDGTDIGDPLFSSSDLTLVYDASSGLGWPTDFYLEGGTIPRFVYSVDNGSFSDSSFRYARWTGSAWVLSTILSSVGAGIIDPAPVASLNPVTSDTYLVRKIGASFEIWRYVTTDDGATWTGTPITAASEQDNLYPLNVTDHVSDLATLWLYGDYVGAETYFRMGIMGIGDDPPVPLNHAASVFEWSISGSGEIGTLTGGGAGGEFGWATEASGETTTVTDQSHVAFNWSTQAYGTAGSTVVRAKNRRLRPLMLPEGVWYQPKSNPEGRLE